MRSSIVIFLFLVLQPALESSARAQDDAVSVPLRQGVAGIDQVFRRCFTRLREAGHDPKRMSEDEIAACMQPEIEAMAEFAYEIATAWSVSSLTKIAAETCTLEQANALADRRHGEDRHAERLTWRWLTDCLKEVRWLDHDEQTERLEGARERAKRIEERERRGR